MVYFFICHIHFRKINLNFIYFIQFKDLAVKEIIGKHFKILFQNINIEKSLERLHLPNQADENIGSQRS